MGLKWPALIVSPERVSTEIDFIQWKVFWRMKSGFSFSLSSVRARSS